MFEELSEVKVNAGKCRISGETLAKQLSKLSHGDHVCSFYTTPDDRMDLIVPWTMEARGRGDACLFVVGEEETPSLLDELEVPGLDPRKDLANGALNMVKKWDWRAGGDFDIPRMADGVKRLVAAHMRPGFGGLWIAVEMTWALDPDLDPGALARWEGHWNDLLVGMPIVLLCQYNTARFVPEFLRPQLTTHPFVIHGPAIYPSCYFEQPAAAA